MAFIVFVPFLIFTLFEIFLFLKIFFIGFTDYEAYSYGLLFLGNTIIVALLGLIIFF